ncbi:MAG: hypothetical protein ABIT38_08420 [Gemmatimonadaceae bacterium]
MRRRLLRAALTIPLSLVMSGALSAQAKTPPATAKRPPSQRPTAVRSTPGQGAELVVVVNDRGLEAPEQVDAGLVNVRLFNRSSGSQHVLLLKVERLDRLPAIVDYLKSGNWNVPWITRMGGPESTPPGGVSSVSMVLEPGRYVIAQLPLTPSSDGSLELGDVEELAVLKYANGEEMAATLPAANATVQLYEWNFNINGPLNAGRRTIRVENIGQFEHQVWIVRLAPGKGLEQAVKWAELPSGAPPFEGIGGTTNLARGHSVNITVDLLAGDYALLCVTYNPLSRKLHSKHGMVKAFRVGV